MLAVVDRAHQRAIDNRTSCILKKLKILMRLFSSNFPHNLQEVCQWCCAQPKTTTDLVPCEFPKRLDIAQVSVCGLSLLSAGGFLLLPLVNLLHPSPWQPWMGTIYGMAAMLALLVMIYTGHLAFPLQQGAGKILPQMCTLAFCSTPGKCTK